MIEKSAEWRMSLCYFSASLFVTIVFATQSEMCLNPQSSQRPWARSLEISGLGWVFSKEYRLVVVQEESNPLSRLGLQTLAYAGNDLQV